VPVEEPSTASFSDSCTAARGRYSMNTVGTTEECEQDLEADGGASLEG
jgi:hypothetical protein